MKASLWPCCGRKEKGGVILNEESSAIGCRLNNDKSSASVNSYWSGSFDKQICLEFKESGGK